jgi:DNA invertase Pin-like site-specific DNA recombinase
MRELIGDRAKVTAAHLARLAFVYVRQSSPRQVRCNRESQRRQYDFAAQAEDFGWRRDQIVIIDEDQGTSGVIPYARTGFGGLVSRVARGEGGIVLSLELSRFARNDPDWHHLVYLCRWTETLIADEQGLYDPTVSADRMVLGIRGQVSELERDNAVHRMVEARWTKARRGEAFTIPPAGYELDDRGTLVPTSDQAVQAALARVFQKFDALGTARQVYLWWRDEGLPFPVRRVVPRVHPVVWVPVSYRLLLQTLHHPIYAGAYVFGRSEIRRDLDPATQRLVVRRVPRKDWPVLIQDHHPAYISFAQFVQNQERIRGNEARSRRTD